VEKLGVVKSIAQDILLVEIERTGGCGDKCASCESKHCATKFMEVPVKRTMEAHVGDLVLVDLSGEKFVKYTFVLYMIPLILFVSFVVLGFQFFKGNELLALLSGFVGLFIAYGGVSLYSKKIGKSDSVLLVKVYESQSVLTK
jgi:sigma-E factor negative regulatory protein RseC